MTRRVPVTTQLMDEAGELLQFLREVRAPAPMLALAQQHTETAQRVDMTRRALRNFVDFAALVPKTEKDLRAMGLDVLRPGAGTPDEAA